MGLRFKIFLTLLVSLLVCFFVFFIWTKRYLDSGFDQAEYEMAKLNTDRFRSALLDLPKQMVQKQGDWASWDDTVEFVENLNKEYQISNLSVGQFVITNVDVMMFVNLKGELVFGKAVNRQKQEEAPIPTALVSLVNPGEYLASHETLQSTKYGLLVIDGQLAKVSSRPILNSEGEGPIHGTLIWVAFLTQKEKEELIQMTRLDFFYRTLVKNSSPPWDAWGSHHVHPYEIKKVSENQMTSLIELDDIFNHHVVGVTITMPRPIAQLALQTTHSFNVSLIVFGLLPFFILMLAIDKLVTSRLESLTRALDKVAAKEGGAYTVIPEMGTDEIGQLAFHANLMLNSVYEQTHKLKSLNSELIDTQQQLIQSQKLDSVGKLAGGIAHDFNNLLGGILGYASLLKEQFKDNPAVERKLSIIEQSASRGSALTRQLLDFARRGAPQLTRVDLKQLLEESSQLFEGSFEKSLTVCLDVPTSLYPVMVDANQMFQVLMNLGLNARDAMLPQGGTLTLKGFNRMIKKGESQSLSEGAYVILEIIDTGCGMPPDVLERIFDPFFTTKDVGKGTGLGLSTVYGIIQNHGGRITVESSPGQGTKFTLYLKALEGDQ